MGMGPGETPDETVGSGREINLGQVEPGFSPNPARDLFAKGIAYSYVRTPVLREKEIAATAERMK